MPGSVPIHRFSAPLPGIDSTGSEPLSPQQDDRLQARSSARLPGVQDLRLDSPGQRAGSIGKPVQLTLPPPPRPREAAPAAIGAESIAEGMDKVSRAQVDVARRGFWRKCLGIAATATALVLMSVATGGLGAAGLVSLGLTAAFLAKGSADTVMSLMNWRNLKAGHAGQPPPFGFLARLPESVRNDATAAMLVGLGAPEKTSLWVSRALDVTLGVGSIAAFGFDAGGVGGGLVAVTPFLISDRVAVITERLENRRQDNVQATSHRMNAVAHQTLMALQDLRALQDRVLAATAQALQAAEDSSDANPPTADLLARVRSCQDDTREMMASLKAQWQDRVALKASAGQGGLVAEVLDGTSESASYTADLLANTAMPFVMVGAMAARALIESVRTARSEWRDSDKLQSFTQQHRGLQREIALLRIELRSELEDLERERSEALEAFQEVTQAPSTATVERPPLAGDPRYV